MLLLVVATEVVTAAAAVAAAAVVVGVHTVLYNALTGQLLNYRVMVVSQSVSLLH